MESSPYEYLYTYEHYGRRQTGKVAAYTRVEAVLKARRRLRRTKGNKFLFLHD